jgi:hypothetical protein
MKEEMKEEIKNLDPDLMCCGYCGYFGQSGDVFEEVERDLYSHHENRQMSPFSGCDPDSRTYSFPKCPHCKKWHFKYHASSTFVRNWSGADMETILERNKKNFPLCAELADMIKARS